jgi:Sugar kinases, ribokinase family
LSSGKSQLFKVASIGNANVDITYKLSRLPEMDEIVLADSYEITTGGSASNYSYAIAKLGAKSHFIGAIGKDLLGEFFLKELKQMGVDVSMVQQVDANTGCVSILIDQTGEKRGVAWRGANLNLKPTEAWLTLKSFDLVHLAGCTPDVSNWVVQNIPVKKSFDPGSSSEKYSEKELLSTVSSCEVSYLSTRQVRLVEQKSGVAIAEFARLKQVVLIEKRGSNGVSVYSPTICFSIAPVKANVVDTTGAGDVFSACFDYIYFTEHDLVKAAKWATVAASLKVTKLGAKAGVPTYHELSEVVANFEQSVMPLPI